MALSAARQKRLILRELGKTGDADFSASVDDWWELFADRAYGSLRLLYLLVKLAAIDSLRGGTWQTTDFKDDEVLISGNQQSLNLQRLRDDVEKDLNAELARVGAAAGPAVGELTTKAPIEVVGEPDPNARRLRGDPLCPPLWGDGRRWP